MKVVLYMAISVNGYIAKENDDTSWVSETEWKGYSDMIKKAGNMIIGRRTYEIMLRNDEFNKSELTKIKTVVISNDASLPIHNSKFVFIAKSSKEAIDILRKQGFKTIMICGGGELNSSFIKENLMDEIYLDIEPIVFGSGIKLFSDSIFESRLELLETKKISDNEIQLHYKVQK